MNERILVVEDDQLLRDLLGEALRAEGYTVLAAADAAQARDLLRRSGPVRLVLADFRLDSSNGAGAPDAHDVTELASREAAVVVMSGDRRARAFAEQVGAHAFIAKPFDLDDLAALVARYARRGAPC